MKRSWIRLTVAALVVTTLGAGWWAVRRGTHHGLYAAAFLPVVAQRVARDASSAEEAAWRFHEFVFMNVRTLSVPALDSRPDHVLLRGDAFCDQAVFAFIHLLREREIPGRLTWLRRADGVSLHTVSEVLLGGEWRLFDTFYGFVPRRRDGTPATIGDVVAAPALLGPSRAEPEWYRHAVVSYSLDPAAPEFPARLARLKKAVIRSVLKRLPDWVVNRLQDLYLAVGRPPLPDARIEDDLPESRLFLRARHYHMFLRAGEAAAAYGEFLRRYPSSPLADDALYNLGLLQLTQLHDPQGAIASVATLRSRYPRSPWGEDGDYLEARAREEIGDCRGAVALYRTVAPGNSNGAEDSRLRLGRLRCVAADPLASRASASH